MTTRLDYFLNINHILIDLNIKWIDKLIMLNPFNFDISSLDSNFKIDCNLLNKLNMNSYCIQDLFRHMFPKVGVKKDNIRVLFVNNLRFSRDKQPSLKALTSLITEILGAEKQTR